LKKPKIELDKIKLATVTEAAIGLFKESKGGKTILHTPEGFHVELDSKETHELIKDSKTSLATLNKTALSESYRYLKHAEDVLNTGTAEGYSDCKTNCRNALSSTLITLTGKQNIREAVKELYTQGIIGEREEEFIESFGQLLVKLYGLASKGGPHPPMTTEKDDAELVFSITASIVSYVANQATKPKGYLGGNKNP